MRPVLVEISVVRQLLPADNVDLRARLVRGLHLILEVPQLQHRAVGGEVAERICLLQLRHAHVGDRVFDRAGRRQGRGRPSRPFASEDRPDSVDRHLPLRNGRSKRTCCSV